MLPQIQSASLRGAESWQTLFAPEHRAWASRIVLAGRNYFKSTGAQLIRGRDFLASEFRSIDNGVIVNEALAQLYWPGQEPLGRQLQSQFPTNRCGQREMYYQGVESLTVIGVIKDGLLDPDGSALESPKPRGISPAK
jgi:hypothetical protein